MQQNNYGQNKPGSINGNNRYKGGERGGNNDKKGFSTFKVDKLDNDMMRVTQNLQCPYGERCIIQKQLSLCRYRHYYKFEISQKQSQGLDKTIQNLIGQEKKKIAERFRQNPQFLQEKQKIITDHWHSIDTNFLGELLTLLDIQNQITSNIYMGKIFNGIRDASISCNEAFQLIEAFGNKKEDQKQLMDYFIKNRKTSPAIKFASFCGFDIDKEYPQVKLIAGQGFMSFKFREALKNDLKKIPLYLSHLETIVQNNQEGLHHFISLLLNNKMTQTFGFSVIKRNAQDIDKDFVLSSLSFDEKTAYNLEQYKYIPNLITEQQDEYAPTEENAGVDKNGTYYNLLTDGNLKETDIYFIDSLQDNNFQNWCKEQLLSQKYIGFDSESSVAYHSGLSLIQLSSEKIVVIFDIVKILKNQQETYLLKTFLRQIIENPDILIIGQGIQSDIFELIKLLEITDTKVTGLVEMGNILNQFYPDSLKKSLNALCSLVMNKPLSKIEQCSGWHQRPLRKAQLHYAGLDAFICYQIWRTLKDIHHEFDFSQFVMKSRTIQKKQEDKFLNNFDEDQKQDQEDDDEEEKDEQDQDSEEEQEDDEQ